MGNKEKGGRRKRGRGAEDGWKEGVRGRQPWWISDGSRDRTDGKVCTDETGREKGHTRMVHFGRTDTMEY